MAELSPPWYTLWNEINSALSRSRGLKVSKLDTSHSPFTTVVTVADKSQAVALASILAPQHQMGNISVVVQVKDESGAIVPPQQPSSADILADMVKRALGTSAWFSDVEVRPLMPGSRPVVFPIFKAEVIQFFNDDLSDYYGNYNNVVFAVFKNILNPSPGGISLAPSTVKITQA